MTSEGMVAAAEKPLIVLIEPALAAGEYPPRGQLVMMKRNMWLSSGILAITLISKMTLVQADPVSPVVAQENVSTASALQLAEHATQLAAARNMKICIAVADADGHLLAFTRMQGAYAGCVEASIAKAQSAARFAINTITFTTLPARRTLLLALFPAFCRQWEAWCSSIRHRWSGVWASVAIRI